MSPTLSKICPIPLVCVDQSLSVRRDKEKEQEWLPEAQLISETGNRVADIARIEGKAAAHAVVNAALAAGLSGGLVDDSSASAPYAAKTGWAYCG